MKKSVIIVFCAVLLAVISSCASQTELADGVAFTINGEPVLQEKWDTRVELDKRFYPDITDKEIMDKFVRERVIQQEAERRGITATDEEAYELMDITYAKLIDELVAAIEEFADSLGLTMDEYKQLSIDTYKEAVMGNKLHDELIAEAADSDMLPENYYEDYIDNLVKTAKIKYK